MSIFSPIQSKHRTQARDVHGKVKDKKDYPTDRTSKDSRAGGTKYNQPNQAQARKQKTKGQ